MKKTYLILNDIRSSYNVGSIFRTADAAGVHKIFLTGYTPAPVDRFGREVKQISKVALGAEKSVDWEKEEDIFKLIKELKKEGFKVIGVEQSKNSVDYRKLPKSDKTVFIFGNEVDGISEEILKESDIVAEIPMKGKKESLNVSVAVGVVLFSFRDF